jgi:mRNA-degrading endonuclease RelE of RelBE toxin-antitoxin system
MQWQISWTATGRRSFIKLPEKVVIAAIEFIYGPLSETSQRVGKELRLELSGLHVARRGDYRVIYHINSDLPEVVIDVIL